jgi:hypothetical protein
LTLGPDPTVRSLLIHRSAAMNIGPQRLVEWLDREKEPSSRQALVLALGEQDPSRLRPADRQATESRLLAVYREDPDPGVHAAAEWALGRWCDPGDRRRQETDKTLTGGKPESGRGWHLSAQGHTMLVVADPSPPTGGRTGGAGPRFAISSKEVTVQQYRRSVPGGEDRQTAPHLPVLGVSWYDAAEYCNWLSHEEGIPKEQWCYEANAAGAFAGGMKIRAGRTGYRLPTEHEWERACRAGTATDYAFGTPADLLGQYAWHGFNSGAEPHAVGLLKPNGLGLFDVHGNASEWCQDGYGDGPGPEPAVREVRDGQGRALRGGAYVHQPSANGFQCRDAYLPWLHDGHTGFRVARTLE